MRVDLRYVIDSTRAILRDRSRKMMTSQRQIREGAGNFFRLREPWVNAPEESMEGRLSVQVFFLCWRYLTAGDVLDRI